MAALIYPIILCGGSGTRLWPLSRSLYPKQFIRFFAGSDDSLLTATVKRCAPERGFEAPTFLCNHAHRFLLQDELQKIGVTTREMLLEPVARNTAPAIAAAAFSISASDENAVMAVMPSDHLIADEAAFTRGLLEAAKAAASKRLVLFGIKPDTPETGYGYILRGDPLDGNCAGSFSVEAFVEKPDLDRARLYLEDGRYLWNSGIFVLHARTFLDELRRYAPDVYQAAAAAVDASVYDLNFRRLGDAAYARAPNISIDYAVMEKTGSAAVFPLDAGWNDVGSWSSLWQVSPHDGDGNTVTGDASLTDTRNSYVHSGQRLVSTLGVENLIVVDTPDAVLVAHKDRAQDVGKIAQALKVAGRREHEQHTRSYRPWGHYETLSIGPRFQVKLLHVKPGGKLSMQMHHHRSEHWVVVKGTAKVTTRDIEQLVGENQSIYINATDWHRLENPGKVPLEVIEVQIGTYLGEDDIIRADDVYKRGADETK